MMQEETWSRRGWRVGVCILKIAIAKGEGGGVQIPYGIILGGKVLIHQAFLLGGKAVIHQAFLTPPPPTPPGRDKRPAPLKFLYNILTIIFVTLLGTSREKQG